MFKKMMRDYHSQGLVSEKKLLALYDIIGDHMDNYEEVDKAKHEMVMRLVHEAFCGPHYNEHFAKLDVENIRYKGKTGKEEAGAYWSVNQVEEATKPFQFTAGVTRWDKFVAFNVFYSDLCTVLSDEEVLKSAHKFFFSDDDGPKDGKVWKYMQAMKEC